MAGKHQIQKLIFDIEASSEQAAKEEIHLIENIIKRRVLATIEKVFDEQKLNKNTLKIESLVLDLGIIDIYQIDSELEFKMRKSLAGELTRILEADPLSLQDLKIKIEPEENVKHSWLVQFLRTGTMPWWQEESMPSKEFIKISIQELSYSSPKKFIKLINENLKYPQFTKRLILFSSSELIFKLTNFQPETTENRIDLFLNILNQYYSYKKITFSELWQAIVVQFLGTPINSRNEALLVKVIVDESVQTLIKKENIQQNEAILLLHLAGKILKNDNNLLKEIASKYIKSAFKNASFSSLSPQLVKLTGKNFWFLNEILSRESFISQLQYKAFRFQFIKQLSKNEKQTAFTNLIPAHLKVIQNIYSFTELLIDLRKTSSVISAQLWFYTEDLFLKNINSQALKTEDQAAIFQSIMVYLAEKSAISPVIIFQEIKFSAPNQLKKTEWKETILLLEKNIKAIEEKNKPSIVYKSEPEQVIHFLLTGEAGPTITYPDFQKLIFTTIYFLLGKDKSSAGFETKDTYRKQLVSQIKSFSILEISLVVDRVKHLSLLENEKNELLQFIFQEHKLAPIILQKDGENLLNWIKNTANTDFLVQYILKFRRMPLNIKWDVELFLIALILQEPEKLERIASTLDLAALNNLIIQLEGIRPSSFTFEKIAKIALDKTKSKISSTEINKKIQETLGKIKELTLIETEKPAKLSVKEEPSKKLDEELEKLAEKELDSDIYIQNAGIVLLSPYLTQIFNKLELLNKEGLWKNDESQIKAVELIHFLTFGTEEMMEYTCVLNKLLVSMPISLPLETQISLSKEEKALCESLLTAVIANWSALKSSSIDNLRGSFLIREGRLSKFDDRYDLKVETRGYDMLIDKIPWSFKLIKYKWMKKPVFVDWR